MTNVKTMWARIDSELSDFMEKHEKEFVGSDIVTGHDGKKYIHCLSIGKVLFSMLSGDEVEEAKKLVPYTSEKAAYEMVASGHHMRKISK